MVNQISIALYQSSITLQNYLDSDLIESSSRYQIFSNGDLVVSNIQEKDSGAYKCIRSNEAGSVSGEAFLGVLVRTHITQPPVSRHIYDID